MDVDPALFDLMVRTSKDQIYVLNKKQMTNLNVINNGRFRPKWKIEHHHFPCLACVERVTRALAA